MNVISKELELPGAFILGAGAAPSRITGMNAEVNYYMQEIDLKIIIFLYSIVNKTNTVTYSSCLLFSLRLKEDQQSTGATFPPSIQLMVSVCKKSTVTNSLTATLDSWAIYMPARGSLERYQCQSGFQSCRK